MYNYCNYYLLILILNAVNCNFVLCVNLFDVLDNELLNIHDYSINSVNNNFEQLDSYLNPSDENLPHFICFSKQSATKNDNNLYNILIKQNGNDDQSKAIYYDKHSLTTCHLIYANSVDISFKLLEYNSKNVMIHQLPSYLKVHTSVVNYLTNTITNRHNFNEDINKLINNDNNNDNWEISIEYSSSCNDIYNKIHNIIEKFEYQVDKTLHSLLNKFTKLSKWFDLLKSTYNTTDTIICNNNITDLLKHYNLNSIDILNIHKISHKCIIQLVHQLSSNPGILKISIQPMVKLLNHDARNIIQSGELLNEPYSDYGLTGNNQICGVADSGVYDLSCYLIDDSNEYPSVITNRSGTLESNRRKIIQYVAFADKYDETGGHGTHVCGSIVGSSQSNLTNMNGMAPDAKITFFDVGAKGKDYLLLPPIQEIFDIAYESGARVHSNSWGNYGGIYGAMSYDLDKYLYDHPDFAVLFAVGNSGAGGLMTVNSPGNAKNCITVGASQVRVVLDDEMFILKNERVVASFSSLGPTFDGRIKPDVVAPGDFIMSAFAGSSDNIDAAILNNSQSFENCAAHQMSGTSMSTPITAGITLLIRQYFMDSLFWASHCNQLYEFCQLGSFTPSGFFLKAMLIHSGEQMTRYSEGIYDSAPTFFPSFNINRPPDVFQGFGEIFLKNILPLDSGDGLDSDINIIVYDNILMYSHQTIGIDIDMLPYLLQQMSKIDPSDEKLDSQIDSLLDNIIIPSLKITVCWYDPPNAVSFTHKLLLHDIDIMVTDPLGFQHWGNLPEYQTSESTIVTLNSTEYDRMIIRQNLPVDISQSDDRNTVEQIHIYNPICIRSNNAIVEENSLIDRLSNIQCLYKLKIHANELIYNKTQNIALIITTAGVASKQYNSTWILPTDPNENHKEYNQQQYLNPNRLLSYTISVESELKGKQNKSILQYSPIDGYVTHVKVSLDFKLMDDTNIRSYVICPATLELTIIDPYNNSVSIGGADESIGKAVMNTEWPDSWYSLKPGTYYATVNIINAKLHGIGKWNIYLLNSYSLSPEVYYNLTFELVYIFGNQTDISSQHIPAYIPTNEYSYENNMNTYENVHIDIPLVELGVKANIKYENNNQIIEIVPDRILLHKFIYSGYLNSVSINLDGYEIVNKHVYFTRGSSAWLFTVVITDPQGLVAQVGGFNWFAQENNFYSRRWPDPWIGKLSMSKPWISTRDISDAGLSYNRKKHLYSKNKSNNEWSIEIAIGYPFGPRIPSNYSGYITLSFLPNSDIKSNENNIIPTTNPTVNPTSLPTVTIASDSYSNIISKLLKYLYIQVVIVIILLCLIYGIIQIIKKRQADRYKHKVKINNDENTKLLSNRQDIQLVDITTSSSTKNKSNRTDYMNLPTTDYGSLSVHKL